MTWEFVAFLIFTPLAVLSWKRVSTARRNLLEARAKVIDELSPNRRHDESEYRKAVEKAEITNSITNGSRIVLTTLAGLFLILSCVWFVPVRNVGIVTAFNAPTGRTTGAGLKVTLPWEEVVDFDASIQVADHTGSEHCTNVRIGSLATACVENRIQWQVQESAAPKLYRDYKGDFNNLRNNLVETKIQNALNKVFATYNPLSQVNINTGQTQFDGAKLGKDVEDELNNTIGSDIKIVSVSVPLVHHDPQTEANIKQFQDVVAQARILAQKKTNADVEKQIADTQRAYLTPEFIENKCIEESVKMGVPPGLCLVNSAIVNAQTTK